MKDETSSITALMSQLVIPVQPPMWEIAGFQVSRDVLYSRIGPPHYIETDGLRTFGGEEDWWAFCSDVGQRLMLCHHVPYDKASIYADPPDIAAAETSLAAAIGDSKYFRQEHPLPV